MISYMEIARRMFCYARDLNSNSDWVLIPAKDFKDMIGNMYVNRDDIVEMSEMLSKFGWVIVMSSDEGFVICKELSFKLIAGMNLEDIHAALINGIH